MSSNDPQPKSPELTPQRGRNDPVRPACADHEAKVGQGAAGDQGSPCDEATAQTDESTASSEDPSADMVEASSPQSGQTDDEIKEAWWDRALTRRRLPVPVKRLAERRQSAAFALEFEQSSAKNDSEANVKTRLPVGEEIHVPAIWLAELYTPTTIDHLINGMQDVATRAHGSLRGNPELVDWIRSSRRRGGASRTVGIVKPKGSGLLSGDWIEDKLPAGIRSVRLGLQTLTPTVTVLTAMFQLDDTRARELESVLTQDFSTKTELRRDGGFNIQNVNTRKTEAVAEWRATLRHQMASWLAARYPGSFHRLARGQLPTIELLLTGRHVPWEPVAKPSDIPGWADILQLGGWFEFWQCQDPGCLRLNERRRLDLRSEERYTLVLASIKDELLAGVAPRASGEPRSLPEVLSWLDLSVPGLLSRWSLTALLRELEAQMPIIQDAADKAGRKGSSRALLRVQNQLLRTGIDNRLVVNDIVRYAQDPTWEYNFPDFSERFPPAAGIMRPSAGSLADSLRQRQAEDGRRISQMENDLRDVLSTNAELAAARANIRLQRAAVWIAIASMVIAAVAAVAAIIAIRHLGGI